ncbi:MAG: LysR family transcriptional regulator [Sphingomonadales bacterium]|nr:LysR family transcriptional regulator [Sphingomonadales bacterium]
MDTAQLRAFVKIAEAGSISRAAVSLGIAQPSLSQQLLRLEDEIGMRLFDRTRRGVTLTEGGTVFLEHARHLLHATELAIAETRHARGEVRGRVVLAMPPSLVRLVGAALLDAIARDTPGVGLRLVEAWSGSIRGWIEAEKIDLGVIYNTGPLPQLLARPLMSDALVVARPPGDGAQALAFAALARARLIAPGPQHGLRQLLDQAAARAGVALAIVEEIDSLDVTFERVSQGAGLAVLPQGIAEAAAAAGLVALAALEEPGLQRRLMVIRNPGHVLTHASVSVEKALRKVLAQAIARGGWPASMEGPGDGE